MMYSGLIYVYIYVFMHYLVNVYHEKFTTIFIIKLIKLSLKNKIFHSRVVIS